MSTLADKFTPEQKRHALEQLLESTTFARADQLRRFLRYICEMEIAGRGQEITEYSIATEAMGRSRGYSPGDDSSVRSRAHALRQKLQEFYEAEQPESAVRVELRKGSYVPIFIERPDPPPAKPQPPRIEVVPQVAAPEQRSPWMYVAAGALAATAITFAAMLLWARTSPVPVDSVLKEAWGSMLEQHADVAICVGSAPSLLLKSFKPGTLPDRPRLMRPPDEVTEWYSGLHMMDGGGDLYMQTTTNTFLVGDSLAAVRGARLLASAGAAVQVLPETGLRPLALRGRNVILIGSPNYSPYAARALRSTPFSVRYDPSLRQEVISEGLPESPKSVVYRPKRDDFGDLTQVYGLLTVFPSHATGEGNERTIVFSGITSAGPQAAMEFFASPSSMRDLKARFIRDGHSGFPPAYQVVVRCGVDRALALSSAFETLRVIKQPPSFD